jgi:hypothetical protein
MQEASYLPPFTSLILRNTFLQQTFTSLILSNENMSAALRFPNFEENMSAALHIPNFEENMSAPLGAWTKKCATP